MVVLLFKKARSVVLNNRLGASLPDAKDDDTMKLYEIRRRKGWGTPAELQAAAALSAQVGDEQMSDDIRWIRSYVVHEDDGTLGTVCIYQASSPEKIREH